jgi:excinuclease UvrABC nuclease subunit
MPCNLSAGEDAYGARVRRAIEFLRGRSGPLLGELARARDAAARAIRFEEAARFQRELKSLTTLAARAERLSRVVTENNLVIVVGGMVGAGAPMLAHVVLSGRLALTHALGEAGDAHAVTEFVAANYERYRARPVVRDELNAMAIVARWRRARRRRRPTRAPARADSRAVSAMAAVRRQGGSRRNIAVLSGEIVDRHS